ncbi:ATP-dependent helicase [Candidatus Saccharibacteria bacterium]|nr:ATP-dependent helicase [Candidatus Saccharibacteria bacterium]
MPLNAKQKEAVEYIEGPLLVLAGPGTGKTHLLSARVEYILKNTDTNPENILCLTFTENGASNMRTRLASTVGAAARRINIHTYHAFGADLLAQYKNYATTVLRNLDSTIDEVMQYKIVKEIQEDLPALDILKSGATGDIVSTIASAKSARLTGQDLAKIAKENIKLSETISAEVSPILEVAKPRLRFVEALEQIYNPILEVLARHTTTKNIINDIEPVANVLARDLKRVIDAERNSDKPKVTPLSAWKNANFEKDDEGHYRLKDRIANKKLLSLGGIMEKYDARLEKEGLYDFADMIEQAIEALKKDKGFRLTEQEKYQYILLDEFQDTNPSQFEIIKLLTDYEEPNVMAVGDDDQAIFEFQGADASNLLTFQQYYGAKVVTLTENYRSNQEILDLSRRVADQIDNSFAKNQGVEKTLVAVKGVGAEISRHEFLTSDSEYQFVASKISELIKSGVLQKEIAIITPKHKYIAPLLPFLKEQKNINIAYEKKDNLMEDPRLSEVLTLARFVFDLSQGKNVSSRLLEILAFPFWGVPPSEAISAVYRAKADHKAGVDYLVKADSPKLRDLGQFLSKLAMLSFDTPLELMMDYMVGTVAVNLPDEISDNNVPDVSKEGALMRDGREFRCPFVEYYGHEQGEYETFELYENLAVLKETILAHSKEKNLRLKDMIVMLDDYKLAGAALMNTSPYRDSEDAVQIVTAHKSKGLEYEYVFLVATDNMSWGKAKGNNNTLALPKNVVQIRHTGITDDERLRLFFVALTRAKRVLVVSNSLKDFAGKSPARLDYLEEYVGEDGAVMSPFVGKVKQHYEDLAKLRQETDLRKTWRSAYAKLTPELRPILMARMENYKLTASDLTEFVDVSYGGPMQFYADKVLRAPREPATESMVFGTLVHAVFEKITNEKIDDAEAVEFYRKEAEKSDLTDKEVKNLLEKGESALKIALDSFGSLIRAQNGRAEVDLRAEHAEIGGVPVTGKLDHIEVNDEARTMEIYDYKTGKYHKEKWGSVATLYKYSLQLGFYKLMLNNAPSFRKYKVTRGHILFVTPDEEGKVYDKVLDFDEWAESGEEERLKKLVKAVYGQATSLGFLDDEELKIEADKNKGLKDVKDFIELLLAKTLEIK